MTKKIKQTIIVAVIIVVAFVGFKMFFGGSTSSDTTLVSEGAAAPSFVDGQTILNLLNNLNQVTLDESIFSSQVFISLVSFERPIQEQVAGRPNPFLPIGSDSSGVILIKTTPTSTRAR